MIDQKTKKLNFLNFIIQLLYLGRENLSPRFSTKNTNRF